jgi:hypothetical protein
VDLVPDALTSALHELGLRCSYLRAETLSGDWRLPFPGDTISLHVLLRGRCSIETDLPLWNRRLDLSDVLVVNRDVGGALIPAGSMAGPTEVLSVGVHLEGPVGHPLLEAIPPLIAARIDRVPLPASFEPTVVALQSEISRPSGGHEFVLMDFCRVLFVQALRIHMLDLSWDDRGYFRALVDPILRDSLLARRSRVRQEPPSLSSPRRLSARPDDFECASGSSPGKLPVLFRERTAGPSRRRVAPKRLHLARPGRIRIGVCQPTGPVPCVSPRAGNDSRRLSASFSWPAPSPEPVVPSPQRADPSFRRLRAPQLNAS